MMLREENWVREVGPVGAVDCSARDEYICWQRQYDGARPRKHL